MHQHIDEDRQPPVRDAQRQHAAVSCSPAGSNWLYQKGSDYRIKNEVGNTAYGTSTGFLSYDGYNRPITNNAIAETPTYTYDALGQRI